jgi:hypothetical protein
MQQALLDHARVAGRGNTQVNSMQKIQTVFQPACARTVARLPALLAGQLLALALGNETNDLVRTRLQSLLKGLA